MLKQLPRTIAAACVAACLVSVVAYAAMSVHRLAREHLIRQLTDGCLANIHAAGEPPLPLSCPPDNEAVDPAVACDSQRVARPASVMLRGRLPKRIF